jgi:hypothetical protein
MMPRTPTPPPPNVDAAAAVAVNVSLITTSPGIRPVAAIGVKVGETNPNVTFAPLGAGGGRQNSGTSAGLQPTTQLNLGTNAGLVGKLGATSLGSTSTTMWSEGMATQDRVSP